MGAESSKNSYNDFQRQNSSRASRKSISKKEEIMELKLKIDALKSQIEQFDGDRGDNKYINYNLQIAQYSTNVCDLKKNKKYTSNCESLLRDLNDCIRILQDKGFASKHNLDADTVESHSFINQPITNRIYEPKRDIAVFEVSQEEIDKFRVRSKSLDKEQRKMKNRIKNFGSTGKINNFKSDSLKEYENRVKTLQKDIEKALNLEDSKLLLYYEKQIEINYLDLELMQFDAHTPLHERKEELCKDLQKMNRKIARAKKKLDQARLYKDSPSSNKTTPSIIEEIKRTKQQLEELDVRASNMEGVKNSDSYKNIKDELNKFWKQFQLYENRDDVTKNEVLDILQKIKSVLQTLNTRAKHNQQILDKNFQELEVISRELEKFKNMVNEFSGFKNDEKYDFIDQNLRKLWGNLSNIKDVTQDVSRRKNEIILEIQEALKYLNNKAKSSEPVYAQVYKSKEETSALNITQLYLQLLTIWSKLVENLDKIQIKNTEKVEIAKNLKQVVQMISTKIEELEANNVSGDFSSPIYGRSQEMEKNSSRNKFNFDVHDSDQKNPNPDIVPISKRESVLITTSEIPSPQKPVFQIQIDSIANTQNNYKNSPNENTTIHDNNKNLYQGKVNNNEKSISNNDSLQLIANYNSFVNDKLKNIDNKENLEKLKNMEENVVTLKKRIDNFSATFKNKEYNDIEDLLMNYIISIEKLDVKNMKQKDDLLQQIKTMQNQLSQNLLRNQEKIRKYEAIPRKTEEKATNEITSEGIKLEPVQTSPEIKEIKAIGEEAKQLKKRVDCFSGTFRNVHYLQIEEGLNKCLEKLDALQSSSEKVQMAKIQVKHRILQYLNILEERSVKVTTIDNSIIYNSIRKKNDMNILENKVGYSSDKTDYSLGKPDYSSGKSGYSSNKPEYASYNSHSTEYSQSSTLTVDSASVDYSSVKRFSYDISFDKIRETLLRIKSEMENFTGVYKDEQYNTIVRNLLKCTEDIKNVDDKGRDSLKLSKQQYLDYITELSLYFEQKLEHSANQKIF